MASNSGFADKVQGLVGQIPEGRVMTYGQIAALSGQPRAARIVGGIAHYGDSGLPWHRVVNRKGGLASGFPGGRELHMKLLQIEGIEFTNLSNGNYLDVEEYIWWPEVK